MPVQLTTKNDALDIVNFTDDVASYYALGQRILAKIATYGAAAQAVAGGTATERQSKFVEMTQMMIATDDIPRIAALVAPIGTMTELLATEYADFIDPE